MSVFLEKSGIKERQAAFSISLIYAIRMFGLFMILPVFALYAEHLPETTPLLTGIALGIYGLTQAVFQIPFGRLSDHIGRKPVIALGLLIFMLGSVVAANADGIFEIIIGRAIQGAGAIAAALMALAADLSREENRTKMMAMIGGSIGVAFALSMVLGPVINQLIGLSGIFALTAVMAVLALLILFLLVPNPVNSHFHRDAELQPSRVKDVLMDPQLARLDIGIFILHFTLMSVFLVLPLLLRDVAGLAAVDHWKVYLPVFAGSVVLMLPFIVVAERKQCLKQVYLGAIVLLALSVVGFTLSNNLLLLVLSVLIFFVAFNFLEASLPSLTSRLAPANRKGTAMGVYSTSQFLGTFAGGIVGGYAHLHWGFDAVFFIVMFAVSIWLLLAISMQNPPNHKTCLLPVGEIAAGDIPALVEKLAKIEGVVEATFVAEEGLAYLKVDRHVIDEEKLVSLSAQVKHHSSN